MTTTSPTRTNPRRNRHATHIVPRRVGAELDPRWECSCGETGDWSQPRSAAVDAGHGHCNAKAAEAAAAAPTPAA